MCLWVDFQPSQMTLSTYEISGSVLPPHELVDCEFWRLECCVSNSHCRVLAFPLIVQDLAFHRVMGNHYGGLVVAKNGQHGRLGYTKFFTPLVLLKLDEPGLDSQSLDPGWSLLKLGLALWTSGLAYVMDQSGPQLIRIGSSMLWVTSSWLKPGYCWRRVKGLGVINKQVQSQPHPSSVMNICTAILTFFITLFAFLFVLFCFCYGFQWVHRLGITSIIPLSHCTRNVHTTYKL